MMKKLGLTHQPNRHLIAMTPLLLAIMSTASFANDFVVKGNTSNLVENTLENLNNQAEMASERLNRISQRALDSATRKKNQVAGVDSGNKTIERINNQSLRASERLGEIQKRHENEQGRAGFSGRLTNDGEREVKAGGRLTNDGEREVKAGGRLESSDESSDQRRVGAGRISNNTRSPQAATPDYRKEQMHGISSYQAGASQKPSLDNNQRNRVSNNYIRHSDGFDNYKRSNTANVKSTKTIDPSVNLGGSSGAQSEVLATQNQGQIKNFLVNKKKLIISILVAMVLATLSYMVYKKYRKQMLFFLNMVKNTPSAALYVIRVKITHLAVRLFRLVTIQNNRND